MPLFPMLSIAGPQNMGMLLSLGRATGKRDVESTQGSLEFGFIYLPATGV